MSSASEETLSCEIAIVGAGMAGSLMAARLAAKGHEVVVLDAGDRTFFDLGTGADQRQELLDRFYRARYKTPNSPYPDLPHAPSPDDTKLNGYYVERGPLAFSSTYTRVVGGTTYHWLGLCPRLAPSTFQERTRYGHAVDWPITYDELEPWYVQVEREIGVAGDMRYQGMPGIPPRSAPFPLPPIPASYSDQVVARAIAGLTYTDPDSGETLPVQLTVTPAARNSIPFQGRPPCSGSANCIPICPIQAKYDATVHLKRALGLDPDHAPRRKARLMMGTVLAEVALADQGQRPQVDHLVFRRHRSRDHDLRVRARVYVLAIHAMELPKVLLASRGQWTHGVANSSGLVGRYLMDHDIAITNARLSQPMYVYRGPRITSSIESLRDGQFRRYRAAFRPELSNVGTSWETGAPFSNVIARVQQGLTGAALRRQVAWDSQAVLHIDAMIEPEPRHDSRVWPSDRHFDDWGLPRPEIAYQVGEYSERGRQVFVQVVNDIYRRLGARDQDISVVPGWFGAGHVMGTTRMGDDPRTSVCTSYGQSHDHDNLYLAGSGLFPTVGTANPTLTLSALALRAADEIDRALSR